MSYIHVEDANLWFSPFKEKSIRDVLTPGSNRFSRIEKGTIHALKNITLDIYEGDRLTVIGHNGAGKSTLLKLLAGIYKPTNGTVDTKGNVSCLFELHTGFEPESTGFDNIYLRGLMLGLTPTQIRAVEQEIAEFSELGDYLNMPVKYYSAGMAVRLAFSISTAVSPEILLLDEVIAAGDAAFLKKAKARMAKLMDESKIMVLVTHDMVSAENMGNRCIWMEHGDIVMQGSPAHVIAAYTKAMTGSG